MASTELSLETNTDKELYAMDFESMQLELLSEKILTHPLLSGYPTAESKMEFLVGLLPNNSVAVINSYSQHLSRMISQNETSNWRKSLWNRVTEDLQTNNLEETICTATLAFSTLWSFAFFGETPAESGSWILEVKQDYECITEESLYYNAVRDDETCVEARSRAKHITAILQLNRQLGTDLTQAIQQVPPILDGELLLTLDLDEVTENKLWEVKRRMDKLRWRSTPSGMHVVVWSKLSKHQEEDSHQEEKEIAHDLDGLLGIVNENAFRLADQLERAGINAPGLINLNSDRRAVRFCKPTPAQEKVYDLWLKLHLNSLLSEAKYAAATFYPIADDRAAISAEELEEETLLVLRQRILPLYRLDCGSKSFSWALKYLTKQLGRQLREDYTGIVTSLEEETTADTPISVENAALQEVLLEEIVNAMGKLSTEQRTAITLRYFSGEGLTLDEVGQKMGIKRNLVAYHIGMGIPRLRSSLALGSD